MLSKSIFFSFLLLLSSAFVFGQNKLVIQHKEKNKQRIFKTGNTFQFITKSDSLYNKGKILNISEQDITFLLPNNEPKDTLTVALDEFLVISKPSGLQYTSYIIGSMLMLSGAYTVLEGPEIANNHWQSRGLGVVGFAVGLVPFLINPKTYSIGETYQLAIITSEK